MSTSSGYGKLPYSQAVRLAGMPQPSATALLTEQAFNPQTEQYVSDPSRDGIFPGARSYRFSMRHNNGGNPVFLDGHSEFLVHSYITNGASNDSGANRAEKLNLDVIWDVHRSN